MKKERMFPVFRVTKKAEASIKNGHPWVYDTELTDVPDTYENGCIADVVSQKGSYLGSGFVSDKSKIRIRLLSNDANESFGDRFFARRIRYALEYRLSVMRGDTDNCRLIFGEADGLPGLTADRYGDVVVTQVLSYGMELIKARLYTLLVSEMKALGMEIHGIYERNDVGIRELEGLSQKSGWFELPELTHPESASVIIEERGIKYNVDFADGQKTGFFLDQKYNREAVRKLSYGRKVLDCFTHTGSFAISAALGGAEKVTATDISGAAIDLATGNARLNGVEDKIEFIKADVFDLLPALCAKKSDYDFIILDPPAFTKNRKTVKDASRGYKEINFRAMKLLPRGGYLATCSCSHFMEIEAFLEIMKSAASDAGVSLKLVEARRQSPDHPTLLNVPETDYLKFFIFQII